MISIIITSFKEPKTIGRAIEAIQKQEIKEDFEIVVSAPDRPTQDVVKQYLKKNKKIKLFKDPGKGKALALNLLLNEVKGEIIVLTDGDVYVGENSINRILEPFKSKSVGCVTGRPIPINDRDNLFGFWSHLLCYAAHKMRLDRNKSKRFLQCSGYLWAFRNNVIKKIPTETAEDTIVPIIFHSKGYKIFYVSKAKVYVKFPTNLSDFVDQKKRTAKAHETLGRYGNINKIPRMKTLKNEVFECYKILLYPKNLKEYVFLSLLFFVRLYIWMLVFYKRYIVKDLKVDGWHATKTTKSI